MKELNKEHCISKLNRVYYCEEFDDYYEELDSAKVFAKLIRQPLN